jgi:cell wall-associated NlpC family hydrolase
MLNLTRLPDWPEELIRTIDAHQNKPFEWGKWDCATLFVDCVRALTGTDPLEGIRPTWTWRTRAGALRAIKSAGFENMVELTQSLFPAVPPLLARRGDLVFMKEAGPITSPAICTGAEMHTRDLDLGWVIAPMEQATMAFRVG